MDFRRFFTYLSNVGMVIFALYLVASIALHHTLYGFKESNVLSWLMYVGSLLQVPLWVYQLLHFKQYKSENMERLMLISLIIFIGLIFVLLD